MARTPVTPEEITRMQELRSEGLSYAAIGKQVGRPATTVQKKIDPSYLERQQKAVREWNASEKGKTWVKCNEATPERKAYNRRRAMAHYGTDAYKAQVRRSIENRTDVQKEARRAYANAWQADARKTNPAHRVTHNLRSRMSIALADAKAGKAGRTTEFLGMTIGEWIATQPAEIVEAMMNGEAVHVDEIRPCSSFDLTDPDQQAVCFNWRNRQLLLAADNLSKGTNWDRSEWEAMMAAKGYVGNLF